MSYFDSHSGWHKRHRPAVERPGSLHVKAAAVSSTELRRWADRLDDQIRNVEDHGGQPQTVRALEDLRDDIERSARMG